MSGLTVDGDEALAAPAAGRGTSALPAGARLRQRRAMAALALGFGILVLVCSVAGVLAWKASDTTRQVLHTLSIRRAAFAVIEQLTQAETAQRGFLLTYDPMFLPIYTRAARQTGEALADLDLLTSGLPKLNRLTTAYRQLSEQKLRELDATVALGQAGRDGEALAIVRAGVGRVTMDQTQAVLASLTASLNSAIEVDTPRQALISEVLLVTIGLAALWVTVLSALVIRDTRRNLQTLEGRELALRTLAATLEHRVDRRTRSLSVANQRFDAALRATGVTVFTQDRDLNYTWVSTDLPGRMPTPTRNRLPTDQMQSVEPFKRHVLESGEADHAEICVMADGMEKWFELSVHPLRDAGRHIEGLIGSSVEITERKLQEARIRLLMREVTHRSKNLLSVIQAIMRQTAANSTSTEDFERRFSNRLHSLAGSQDLLVQEDWTGASLRELVRSQLSHYSDLVGSQIELSGPAMQVKPDAAQNIGMALHELATNAAKYGALSMPQGRVRISWWMPGDHDDRCHLLWEESCGPPVVEPSRRGFGRVMIERMVARAVDGEVKVSYPPSGVRWELIFPRSALV